MRPPGAVVVGGDYRGLGLVRGLGRSGVDVVVVHGAETLATRSRYCRGALLADPGSDLVETLLEFARRRDLDGWSLFPTTDEAAWTVSAAEDLLARRYRLTTPGWPAFSVAADKRRVAEVARAVRVATPRTWLPRTAADLPEVSVAGPVIVKPARRRALNDLTALKGWRAESQDELVAAYRRAVLASEAAEVMVQEFVPGSGDRQYSFAGVCELGVPVQQVTVVRRRQYPPDIGRASCFVETVRDEEVESAARRVLAHLQLSGLVEVEFKRDPRDRRLKLLDVNARVWGWHSVAQFDGADFGVAAHNLAQGRPVPRVVVRPGLRWSRLAIDLPYALREVTCGRLTAADLTTSLRPPLCGPIWARDDLRPALFEVPLLALAAWRQRFDRRPSARGVEPGPAQSVPSA